MDKREIEQIKEYLKHVKKNIVYYNENLHEEMIDKALTYINNLEVTNDTLDKECSRLEKKEFILDKVTEKLKEDSDVHSSKWQGVIQEKYAKEILELISSISKIPEKN